MYLFWNYIYDVRPWTVVYFIENVRLDKPGNGCGFLIDFAVRLWTSPWSKGYRTATPLTSAVGATWSLPVALAKVRSQSDLPTFAIARCRPRAFGSSS